ncbi:hypothetical protein T281_16745 [Rhodomicrobium udaipurense JA643]|uniref:Uncharacterized protein n=1 Tax=Rhodomicrobium udaipurense TaxID=1202716 RepID=A0A8I1KKP3_9HYPH|nr:hypothetical protein [Rhodomicrobium udaipurense]KAI93431.1 hypothetical protein T281_16745 [Rhodomicrobium udaipurense JA643]MBJ7545172.1 hypothetical protein [Rhodomicrobium udaipurense]
MENAAFAPVFRFIDPAPPRYGQTKLVEEMQQEVAKHVHAMFGPEAFDCPKTSAAWHEAGHCILYVAEGFEVRSTSIFPIVHKGTQQWIGKTDGGVPYTGPDTTAQDDLRHARRIIAGFASEALFDRRNCKPGSSLNERILVTCIAHSAAAKLGVSFESIERDLKARVTSALERSHRARRIAMELIGNGSINARRLEKLLGGVTR